MFGGPSGKLPSSTSSHNFSQVPRANIQRSAFDRSYTLKTTCQAGVLVPFFLDEVLPGDTFALNSTIFARMGTSLVPLMDNLELTTQYFFVPNRLVWSNWEKFMGAQDNPGDSISYTIPQLYNAGGTSFGPMTIGDYFGLPINVNISGSAGYCSALPFRAYYLIWNTWYRDENLQNSLTVNTGDGPDNAISYVIQSRGKTKDYFYGALPWAQKGTAVTLPIGTSAPVTVANGQVNNYSIIDQSYGVLKRMTKDGGDNYLSTSATAGDTGGTLFADLSAATGATINAIRLAFQQQKFLERDARGGTRYIELILSHFGVVNPDFRLQRPEYLGGGVADINTTPIPQTTPSGIAGTTTKFGDLAAFSTALSGRNGFTKSFTEHGHILGLLTIRAKNKAYQQGLAKMWQRQTRYDFYWPVFAHLGEQTITMGEIYYRGDKAGANLDATVWGYAERYAEYRYNPSLITGMFKSTAASTLDLWHLAQYYGSAPALNSTFITDDTATVLDRNLAVAHSGTVPAFKVDVFHKLHCARPMPVFGVPGNMDRF